MKDVKHTNKIDEQSAAEPIQSKEEVNVQSMSKVSKTKVSSPLTQVNLSTESQISNPPISKKISETKVNVPITSSIPFGRNLYRNPR